MPAEAIQEFRAVHRLHGGDPLFLLAQSGIARCAVVRKDSAAFDLYQVLLGRRGESVMGFVRSIRTGGFWTRELWPDADLELGKLYSHGKDTVLAEEHLRRCLNFWNKADAGDRRLREAQTILLQLTKGR